MYSCQANTDRTSLSVVRGAADHAPHSKRAMAGDCMALMRRLGHDQFAVAAPRSRQLRRVPAGDGPSRGRPAPGGAGQRADPGGAGPLRRDLRDPVVALVLPGQSGCAAERVINADPDACYHGDGERAQMGSWHGRITSAPSTIRPHSPPCARTTAPGSALTAITMTPTWPAGACCPAQSWCYGRPVTTWHSSTATQPPSSTAGPGRCKEHPSTTATTSPRGPPRSSQRRSSTSCQTESENEHHEADNSHCAATPRCEGGLEHG